MLQEPVTPSGWNGHTTTEDFRINRVAKSWVPCPVSERGTKPSRPDLIGIESADSIRFHETHDVCPAIDALNIHIPHERHSQTPSRL